MNWLTANWFNIIQTVALIVTLSITVSALKSSERATKGGNTLAINVSNRELWGQLIANPQLQSVNRSAMDAGEEVRYDERRFILQVIRHAATIFELAQMGGINPDQGMRRDVYDTLNRPVFKAVWGDTKIYENADFVEFIDNCIAGIDLDKPVGRRPNLAQQMTQTIWSRFSGAAPR